MKPVLLDASAARTCAHRVRLDHDRDAYAPKIAPTLVEQRRMEAGRAFENDVVAQLLEALGPNAVDLRAPELRDPEETLAAMDAHVRLIIGGKLPDDTAGGRKGIPDLLVHMGRGRYLPGDIKWHKVSAPQGKTIKPALTSPLRTPSVIAEDPTVKPLGKGLWPDLAQLAHYTRMLQAIGRHPGGQNLAALVGRPEDETDEPLLVWYDLDAALGLAEEPADPAAGSVLDTYDARHDLRLRASTGRATTLPVRNAGCSECRWLELCRESAGKDDASFALDRDTMKPADWLTLRALGITSVDDLADHVPPTPLRPTQRDKALAAAIEAAQMIRDGVTLARTTTGPLVVPSADVEVDIDLEWDTDGLVYLWAGTVRHGPSLVEGEQGRYFHFSSFDLMTPADEFNLAEAFVGWLKRILAKAEEKDHTVTIFHYTYPERTHLSRVLGDRADAYLEHFVDLHDVVKENYVGPHGLSIKKVAPHFGFDWRDDDPGGLQSQDWLIMAREADDPAVRDEHARRILTYNEDDVRAQAAIRDGMRSNLRE